jgi:preprotein translocase subunit YajC
VELSSTKYTANDAYTQLAPTVGPSSIGFLVDFSKFDPTLLLMGAVLVVLVIFMVRNSRKRRRDALEMQEKVKVGAEVMTNFGVYAKIKKIDTVDNKVILETSPGQTLTVHRQVIARVVEAPTSTPSKAVADVALSPAKESAKTASNPQFGERVQKPATKAKAATKSTTTTRKPASGSSK